MTLELTEKQTAFVLNFTSGAGAIGNASEAARRAGYSVKTAGEIGAQLLKKPHVCDAIEEANRAQIGGTLATKAVGVLQQLIDDETVPAKVRLDAAKTILDRSGYAPSRHEILEEPPKRDLNDLSIEELTEIIDRELARKAEEEGGPPRLAVV